MSLTPGNRRTQTANRRIAGAPVIAAAIAVLSPFGLFTIAGCGGGSRTATIGGAPGYRAAVGQSWSYHVTGTATISGSTVDLVGDVTNQLLSTSVPGASFMNVQTGSIVAGNVSSPVSNILIEATKPDGGTSIIGILNGFTGVVSLLASPVSTGPRPLAAGATSSSQSTTTDTGMPLGISETVVDEETVTVPAGTFETWKITGTTVEGATTNNNTTWFAPSIGAAVKIVSSGSNTSGVTADYTYQLTSTNVYH